MKNIYFVSATSPYFPPELNYSRADTVHAEDHTEAEMLFKERYGSPYGINADDIDIENCRLA